MPPGPDGTIAFAQVPVESDARRSLHGAQVAKDSGMQGRFHGSGGFRSMRLTANWSA